MSDSMDQQEIRVRADAARVFAVLWIRLSTSVGAQAEVGRSQAPLRHHAVPRIAALVRNSLRKPLIPRSVDPRSVNLKTHARRVLRPTEMDQTCPGSKIFRGIVLNDTKETLWQRKRQTDRRRESNG